MNTKIKKLVTHNGSFHADDIFATAVLSMFLGKKGETFEIIRTRKIESIEEGDYVFDVGGIYDPDRNRFDHHQLGGAGKRSENNIEYSSFGLVWKKFGPELCDSVEVAKLIDKKLVTPIDARDNGIDLKNFVDEISSYTVENFFSVMRPSWTEDNSLMDKMFIKCVAVAKAILEREIIYSTDYLKAQAEVKKIYEKAEDKRIIILENDYAHQPSYEDFPELLYIIYPRQSDGNWTIKAIRKNTKSFELRKPLPKAWAGLRETELQKVTGVPEAIFCHRALFMAIAKNKEAVQKLAELALL